MKEFKKLLKEYKRIIDLAYWEGTSTDYTPDNMSYDFEGFLDLYSYESYEEMKEEIKKHLPQLREAVKHAIKYESWLTSKYNYTFG
jgi:hypothetical protein